MIEHERTSNKTVAAKTKLILTAWFMGFIAFLFFVFVVVVSFFVYDSVNNKPNKYVTSRYSDYCYHVGQEVPSMKTRMYFRTLAECGKPVYQE